VYWASGSIKALTALASIGTAVLLVSVIPEALALRSPAELEAINETLKNEITERRRAEEEVLKGRELLVRQERMRVVGQLASGIAHDLNNTLNVIKLRVAAMARTIPSKRFMRPRFMRSSARSRMPCGQSTRFRS
jgi:signal transduction histidine kinase